MILCIINIVMIFVQFLIAIRAVKNLMKYILDVSSVLELLYIIWFIPVIYDMMTGGSVFSYVYKIANGYDISAPLETLTYFNVVSTMIMISFELGYSINRGQKRYTFKYNTNGFWTNNRYLLVQTGCFVIFIYLEYRSFMRYGGSIYNFFSASRKADIYGSFYIKTMMTLLPQIMLTNYLLKQRINEKKLGIGIIIYLLIMVMAILPSGQRRDIVCDFLFTSIMIILFLYNSKSNKNEDRSKQNSKILRKNIAIIFSGCVALVPILWYMRSRANQIERYGSVQVKTTRGAVELIFGSGATGFPTMIAIHNFCDKYHINFYVRNIFFILESWIPRNIFPNKISVITEYMQTITNTDFNLSLFYINDLYFTFGVLSIPISFGVGVLISKIFDGNIRSNTFQGVTYSCLLFSEMLLLFKNGLTDFLVILIFTYVLFSLDFIVLNPKGGVVKFREGKIIIQRSK